MCGYLSLRQELDVLGEPRISSMGFSSPCVGFGHQKGGWHEGRELERPGDALGHLGMVRHVHLISEVEKNHPKALRERLEWSYMQGCLECWLGLQRGERAGRRMSGRVGEQSGDGGRNQREAKTKTEGVV